MLLRRCRDGLDRLSGPTGDRPLLANRLVERLGFGFGCYAQFILQQLAAALILLQGCLSLALRGIELHQRTVHPLLEWVQMEKALGGRYRLVPGAGLGLVRQESHQGLTHRFA